MNERLTMKIAYSTIAGAKTRILSNIKREYWGEILSGYLQLQMGKGKDETPTEVRDEYEIIIQIDIEDDDTYYSKHNCGNKGLRDGILMDVLAHIATGDVVEE